MGDRSQVVVKHKTGEAPIFIYHHWLGPALASKTQRALRFKVRWTDASYLTRIIFNECQNTVDTPEGKTKEDIGYEPYQGVRDNSKYSQYPQTRPYDHEIINPETGQAKNESAFLSVGIATYPMDWNYPWTIVDVEKQEVSIINVDWDDSSDWEKNHKELWKGSFQEFCDLSFDELIKFTS